MEKTFIGVRGIDKETFSKFRAMAVAKRMRLGDAFTKAMRTFMERKEKNNERDIGALLKMKPINVGKKVKWSEEIDEILYGS